MKTWANVLRSGYGDGHSYGYGYGDGYGNSNGDGYGDGYSFPPSWLIVGDHLVNLAVGVLV